MDHVDGHVHDDAADHVDDDVLAALALGDTDDLDPAAATHVAGCATCHAAVEELRAAVAVARRTPDAELVAPPSGTWEAVAQGVGAPASAAAPSLARPAAPRRRAVPVWVATSGVAAALVLGVLGGRLLGRADDPPARVRDTVVARADLSTVGGSDERGVAEVVRHGGQVQLRVRTSHLGTAGDGLHEVWLLSTDGSRLVSLGVLGPSGSGSFAMPERLLAQGYLTVDVSAEPDDGDPAHSGDSLARGRLGLT